MRVSPATAPMEWKGTRPLLEWLRDNRFPVAVGVVVVLFNGAGLRNLLGIPLYAAVCVLTVVVGVAALTTRWVRPPRMPGLLAAFLLLAAASVIWSQTRLVTVGAICVTAAVTTLAILLYCSFDDRTALLAFHRALFGSVLAGLAFEVVAAVIGQPVPPLNVTRGIGDLVSQAVPTSWSEALLLQGGPIQGLSGNRNVFASLALLSLVLGLMLGLERTISWQEAAAAAAASALVLALTRSATITVTAACLLILGAGAALMRRVPDRAKRAVSWTFASVCLALGILLIRYWGQLLDLLDRGSDLSNRSTIWRAVADFAALRPEGWGWVSAYWPVWRWPYGGITINEGTIPHAHNAFMDAWLELGIPGLGLLALLCAWLASSAWRVTEKQHPGESLVPVTWMLLTAALIIQSFTESRLLQEGWWALFVVLACSVPSAVRLSDEPAPAARPARVTPEAAPAPTRADSHAGR